MKKMKNSCFSRISWVEKKGMRLKFRLPGILIFAFCLLPFAFPNMALAQGAGKALDFDGTDDYVDCGSHSSLDITGALTLEAWVNVNMTGVTTVVGTYKYTGADERAWKLSTATGTKVVFYVSGDGSNTAHRTSNSNAFDGSWHHVVGVFSPNSNLDIYVDGVLDNGALSGAIPASLHDAG